MKLLIGGSPCTHWSIAQTKNRETEASGIGWELFLNYRIEMMVLVTCEESQEVCKALHM